MLDFPLHRTASLVLAMEILYNLFDTDEVIETDDFYFSPFGDELEAESMPRFWYKHSNIQVTWYGDDPGRGAFSNRELSADDVISLLMTVREDYDNWRDGK